MKGKSRDNSPGREQIREKGEQRFVDLRLLRQPPAFVSPRPDILKLAQLLAPGFYLDVGNVCNQRCLYCAVARDTLYRTTRKQASNIVSKALGLGHTTCVLIGGEPTIWPYLAASLDEMKRGGVERVILTTNGLMLAYPQFLNSLIQRNVATVGLSFDDFDPSFQKKLSLREDNPEILAAVIKNLRAADVDSYFYTVVTSFMRGRGNDYGARAAETAASFLNRPAFFLAALKPVEEAKKQMDDLSISLTQTAAEVVAAIETAGSGATVSFRDIPLCLVPEHLPYSMDLYHRNATLELESGVVRPASISSDRTFAAACDSCRLREQCPGIYGAYVERYGEEEFSAVE